jgi:oligoribonuclease NrnB/cAMP/cGMP phosphodiesterase (DHH superfamily)
MTNVLNITHAQCLDGMTSAWLVRKVFPSSTVIAWPAGEPLPPIPTIEGGWDLILVTDTSFTLEEMNSLKGLGAQVVLLDHHKSAFDRLEFTEWDAYLSKNMSGALLTYNWLCDAFGDNDYFPIPVGEIAQYVSDNDTWQHKLQRCKDFVAYAYQHVNVRDPVQALSDLDLLQDLWGIDPNNILNPGKQIREVFERLHRLGVDRAVWSDFAGYRNVPIANVDWSLKDDVGNLLAKEALARNSDNEFAADFSICWYIEVDEGEAYVRVSLRAATDSGNCLDFATMYGGGGHIRACGCRFKPSEWFKMLRDETGEEWS